MSLNNIAVTVGFSQTEYSFNENDGGVVCVVLLNGAIESSFGSVMLTLNATDGSATGNIMFNFFNRHHVIQYACLYRSDDTVMSMIKILQLFIA